ncbi:NAD(P)/FAD-dependent oxidoreductase [uncultured Desulfosarcina sp.]|uniref:NAD(P)/FAD-dependent oxidoreductase n=1 Tax=uncultured Desulfosarcina sp. TaxID=218289 RepID=UPI0029C8E58C|nr:NAD(P)/FAD-dependent oxidoreductase [uncultured Desulfosarcina sp.]
MTTPAVEQSLLFTPITIGRMEIKNRIIMPAMILNYPVDGFDLSPKWYHFYRRAARGGSGLIICGATFVDRVGKQDDHQLGADCDDWLPALTKVAEVIHENGAKAALQLNHAGRYSWKSVTGSDPVAPSPIYTRYTKLVPKELTTTEVEGVLRAFADAALRAKKAGFDAVELLGATGYLISQFMSPLTNIRTDRFGGDFEGRLTFVKELIQGIKAATGNDFPLIFRHSSTDNMPGGLDASDQRRVAVKLAEWGVDMLNVTAGWHDSPVHQIGPSVPHGYFVPLATKIKAEVNIPVSCAFRITEPELARELVDKDKLDMVTMCRALLADPDWPAKAQALKDGAIRRCICCCHCFDEAFKRAEMDCAINPELGKPDLSPTAHPKHILVVGAGPGGLEAARVLTLRGHAVTLIESGDAIGGKLEMASAAPHKGEFLNLIRYYRYMIGDLGIKCLTSTHFQDIRRERIDGVVVASGSRERRFSIKGESSIDIHMASDVLVKGVLPRGPVVILGAGLVGGETADMLVEKGIEVSLVDMAAKPFKDMGATLKWVLTGRLRNAKIRFYMESTITEINPGEVVIQKEPAGRMVDGDVVIEREDLLTKVPAGSLVFAAGYEPDETLLDQIKASGLPYLVIGDAKSTRRLKDAVAEGYLAGTQWVDEL